MALRPGFRAIATRMARMGHQVFMVCAKTSPGEPSEETIEGVHVRRVTVMPEALLRRFPPPSYFPQALFYLLAPPIVWSCTRRWRIDAIRDDMSPFPGLSLLAPFLGPRALVVVHNLFGGVAGWRRFYSLPFALAGALGERLLLRGLLRYRAVATAAPWLAAYVRQRGSLSARVEPIPNGIDLEAIPRRTPRGRVERIVSFGRFSAHKGLVELIAAAAELRDRQLPFHLTLIGGGPLEPLVRARIAASSLEPHVSLAPTLPRAELLRALTGHDLFVLSSASEGLPMSLLEAMAAGLPAIVADRPYVQGLVTSVEARLFDLDRPGALADAIATDLRDPAGAEARAARARTRVEDFSWDRAAEGELRLLLGR